jgi:hypothetical protein
MDEPQLSNQGENLGNLQTLILMVHSHLMFKSVLNENLGGILGST